MIIAIDFDGTIVEDRFPEIGEMMPGAREAINRLFAEGNTIIIWSCRNGIHKARAIEWLVRAGIKFHYFNRSCPDNVKQYGSDTRKVYADLYIDDKGVCRPLPKWEDIYDMILDL